MIINEVRPHDTIGVANWRALQSAVKQKSAATLQHSDTAKTYSEQQTIKLYRWAKLHLDRNEQHAVFDKLASAEKIAQLLPNLPLREVASSKTKYSRNEDGMKNWVEIQRAVRHSSSNSSDPRHAARLSVGDQQAVLSKSDAERLFRWLKSKFRTKKERDLFEFLGSTQLFDLLKTSLTEKWSAKYKRSIDCSNPKGFSQRAHCAGRKKNESVLQENGDMLVKAFFTKSGKPVGEVGIDLNHSPEVGRYYMKHYESKKKLSGFDTFREAFAELERSHDGEEIRESIINELAPGNDSGDNRPERPLSLVDVAKIIKTNLGPDWTMERVGRTEQPGYKFIPTDKTKHGMAKIWCLVDWDKVGEYPTYNTILYDYQRAGDRLMAHGRQTERAKSKTVANAMNTARLILNNKGGLKDVVSEGEYSDEEIERYGPELIQRQRNLDFLRSVFGYNNLHRIARALRQGNLKQRLSPSEGDSEYRSRYRRAVRILDAMTDEVGNIIPHTEDARYPKLK